MRSSSKALRAAATGAASVALGASALAFAPVADAATQATTPMCTTAQLTGALGGEDAGAGQLYYDVVLSNHSTTTCHLTGYPGVSVLDSHGNQVGAPATHDPRAYSAVVLAPHASATTTIHTGNRMTNDPGECRPATTALRVYPPGNRASLVVPAKLTVCDIFTVIPMVAGGSTLPTPPAGGGSGSGTPTATPSSGSSATPSATPSSQ
ncbi:DUF4232 domain-containing protein, partial [Streptacidiphilus melanogenes]|uniref:DUF4232 domain-containing protein n=1 Tax=Streptacidiphilus melanogenes TaxID=411235 RepID=UPI00126A764C